MSAHRNGTASSPRPRVNGRNGRAGADTPARVRYAHPEPEDGHNAGVGPLVGPGLIRVQFVWLVLSAQQGRLGFYPSEEEAVAEAERLQKFCPRDLLWVCPWPQYLAASDEEPWDSLAGRHSGD